MENSIANQDWLTLTQFFPYGWEEKAYELGVLTRKRKFKNPSDLLRVLLIHFSDHCSLKEAVTKAKIGKLVDISDVALLKKIILSSEWFRWMTLELIKKRFNNYTIPEEFQNYTIKSVDASVITEPGSTGTDWRLHYSLELFGLKCDEFRITKPNVGESFTNFLINKNDIYIGDRCYSKYHGLKYVTNNGGYFVVRYQNKAFKLFDEQMQEFNLIEKIRSLEIGELSEITAYIATNNEAKIPVRICTIKKSKASAEESIKKAIAKIKREHNTISEMTLELYNYIIVVTSLPEEICAMDVMKLYRLRWQIELAFKRLKSIFGLGHLPKKDIEAARAWLHGKLFVAILTQTVIEESLNFSPWGYPI
jgi:hypothetical protein